LGDISFSIDGVPLDFADTVTYRGMMFSGVPNLVWVFGYFARVGPCASIWSVISSTACSCTWTNSERRGSRRDSGPRTSRTSWLEWVDVEYFNPNYFDASMHLMPKRLDKPEWRHTQDYWANETNCRLVDLDEGCLVFE